MYPKWIDYKRLHGASDSYIKRLNADWRNYYEGTEIIHTPIAEFTKFKLDIWAHELIQQTGKTKKQYVQRMYRHEEKKVVEHTKCNNAGRCVTKPKPLKFQR